MDIEAIGGAATGGLIASAFEKPTGHAGEAHAACADCGTQTIGRFCHNCGNASHVHRTLLHLGEELLHGVMHFDSRTWRTLPMLVFRPGQLTRSWAHGMRARYVSPLALFLFTIFVMFMALTYLPKPEASPVQAKAQATAELARSTADVARARRAVGKSAPEDLEGARKDLAEAEAEAKAAAAEVERVRITGRAATVQEDLASEARHGALKLDTGNAGLNEKIRHKLENPELAIYKMQQTIYKFSFLLVPISIPFVALLFLWKRNVTLYDHGVFVLYSLTFMAVLAMAAAALGRVGGPVAAGVVSVLPLAVPTHMFFQLQGAYGLGWASALWRMLLLLLFCGLAMALFILAIIWLGLG